jgi:hypothetical protein
MKDASSGNFISDGTTAIGDKSPSQMIIPNARDAAHNGHSWFSAA